jgi:hypothetical protein
MTDCERYIDDPGANATHLETCAECRALEQLNDAVEHRPIAVDTRSLPLAAWEGATHRPWPLVLGAALAVVAIALALCAMSGMSPSRIVDVAMGSINSMRAVITFGAQSLRDASAAARAGFVALVVVVNALLFALLRRAPRGIDA